MIQQGCGYIFPAVCRCACVVLEGGYSLFCAVTLSQRMQNIHTYASVYSFMYLLHVVKHRLARSTVQCYHGVINFGKMEGARNMRQRRGVPRTGSLDPTGTHCTWYTWTTSLARLEFSSPSLLRDGLSKSVIDAGRIQERSRSLLYV